MNIVNVQIQQAQQELIERTKNGAKRFVWVTLNREGIHQYPAALNDDDLAEVQFLGHPHRHIFHMKVAIEVFHNDREIEFILFKRFVEGLFDKGILHLDSQSCEMISDNLYLQVADRYPRRDIVITVSEDAENGSEIYYTFQQP